MITDPNHIRWKYNTLDISYTLEIAEILKKEVQNQPEKLQEFWHFQQTELVPALTRVMNRGVRVDLKKKKELFDTLSNLLLGVESKLNWLVGEEFNPNSPLQVKKLFKELLGVTPILNPKTRTETFGADAMISYLQDYPLLRPLITLLLEYRSIGVFVRTFLAAEVDGDGRMRSSYNAAGTRTYRLASRKNAFGKGMNLQNIPSKGKIDLKYSLETLEAEGSHDREMPNKFAITDLPNCKQLFIPDEGKVFFDVDYSGADAMIVAWDSNCEWLINFFTSSEDKLYLYLAQEYLQKGLTTKSPEYKSFKAWTHGTHYGMGVDKAAKTAGISLLESKGMQKWYFGLCPEIPKWHKGIEDKIKKLGYIDNVFGARGYFLDRNDPTLLNKAYAWIPQSTIGIMVNKGLVNIDREAESLKNYSCSKVNTGLFKGRVVTQLQRPEFLQDVYTIEVLMQVHDSLAGQYDKKDLTAQERILGHMSIELPYPTPLTIPAEIGVSELSYGDC